MKVWDSGLGATMIRTLEAQPDIRNSVALLARIARWQPLMRRPLPGNEVLGAGVCATADDGPRDASSQIALAIPDRPLHQMRPGVRRNGPALAQ